MNKRPRTSVFTVLVTLFAVVMLPMYLLGYGIFQWGYQMTTDEITQSIYTRASFFTNTLESEIQRIRTVHQECLNDSDLYYYVNSLSIMGSYEKLTGLLNIVKRLELVHNSSAYIKDVKLWMPRIPRMVTSSGGVESMMGDWQKLLDAPVISPSTGLMVYEGELYFCSSYPAGISYTNNLPQYVLAVQLSNEKISEELMGFNLYPEAGTLLQATEQDFHLETGQDIRITGKELTAEGQFSVGTYRAENGEEYLLLSHESTELNMRMHTYISKKSIYGGLDTYRGLFVIFTVAVCLLILAYLWFSRRLISQPVRRLVDSLRQVENGRLDVRIDHRTNDEFSYLYASFNQMAESLENMFEINYRQRMLAQEAELRQLQAQINPHFLHNSFFILYRMAKDEDYDNISEFLTYLSDYYRYITRNASIEVDMEAEDGHARRYVQIQLVRFKKRISADFAPLPEKFKELKVPRLILQPLLENAFNHGLKDTVSDGLLRVWYEERDTKFLVFVEDNGSGMQDAELEALQKKLRSADDFLMERSGIINIHQRLRIRFGPDYGLKVEKREPGGARFIMMLPYASGDEAPGKE